MATSTLDQLLISKAEVFLINGTEDESVPIEAFDILRAELLRHRRSFKFKVIPGANHGLDMPGEGKGTDRERAFKEAVE